MIGGLIRFVSGFQNVNLYIKAFLAFIYTTIFLSPFLKMALFKTTGIWYISRPFNNSFYLWLCLKTGFFLVENSASIFVLFFWLSNNINFKLA